MLLVGSEDGQRGVATACELEIAPFGILHLLPYRYFSKIDENFNVLLYFPSSRIDASRL